MVQNPFENGNRGAPLAGIEVCPALRLRLVTARLRLIVNLDKGVLSRYGKVRVKLVFIVDNRSKSQIIWTALEVYKLRGDKISIKPSELGSHPTEEFQIGFPSSRR